MILRDQQEKKDQLAAEKAVKNAAKNAKSESTKASATTPKVIITSLLFHKYVLTLLRRRS
jgi:hypothetical protein